VNPAPARATPGSTEHSWHHAVTGAGWRLWRAPTTASCPTRPRALSWRCGRRMRSRRRPSLPSDRRP